MSESMLAYISAGLAARLADRPPGSFEPEESTRTAIVLFADISGFSALTERLAREGSNPDRIGEILSTALGSVVDAVTGLGGDVMTFAGDAVLATWPDDDIEQTLARVLTAVGQANTALEAVDTGTEEPLKLRTGLARGSIREVLIGGINDEWHHLTAGIAVRAATAAAGQAEPGQLMASLDIAGLLDDRTTPAGQFADLDYRNPPPFVPQRRAAPPAHPSIEAFVPTVVREAVEGGHSDWLAELRRLTMAFVRLDALGDSMDVDALQESVQTAQRIANEYNGSVARVLYDDKGLILVLRWTGLQANRDIATGAVQAALELQRQIPHTSIGLATGTAFVGQLGSKHRRDYTTIGHAVNRAARLMETAHDEVLCDSGIRAAASEHIAFVGRGVMPVKGFQEPVAFYRPLGVHRASSRGDRPLVARDRELAHIADALEGLRREGRQAVITVTGPAGIGKSRLVQAALERVGSEGLRRIVLSANQLTRSSAYAAWRPVIRSLMGLGPGDEPQRIAARARDLVAPEQRRFIPLLLSALGTEESTGIEEGDADATRDILSSILRTLLGDGPSVVVLEDVQWSDSASLLLAEALYRQRPATAIIGVGRPVEQGEQVDDWHRFVTGSPGPRIDLGPLADADAVAIACQMLGVDFLPPTIADLINEKADGHPLFTEELVQSLREQGVVATSAEGRRVEVDRSALRAFVAPATLQETVAVRLDQLHLDELLTLKVASVLGRSFDPEAVAGVHPTVTDHHELGSQLGRLASAELVLPDHAGYTFKHAVLRDVTYSLIPDRQRRQLHADAAAWYSGRPGETDVYMLGQHWREAQNFEQAVAAFERAGDLSLRTGSFHEAADIFADTYEIAPATVAAIDRARWKRKEAVSQRGLGNLAETHTLLVAALAELGRRLPAGPALLARIAVQTLIQAWHRLRRRAAPSAAPEAALERAQIYFALGTTTFANLDALSLFYAGLSALNEAERAPDSGVLALGHSFLMYVIGVLGLERASSRYHRRAVAAAERSPDPSIRAEVLYNRAGFLGTVAAWDEAASLHGEALRLYEEHGNHRGVRTTTSVMAYHAHLRGRIEEEERHYDHLAHLAQRFDDGLMTLFADAWRAEVALRRGRPERALTLTADHLDIEVHGDRAAALKVLGVRALAFLRIERVDEGFRSAREALELIRTAQAFTAPYAYDGYVLAARFWIDYDEMRPGDTAVDQNLHDVARALRQLRRGLRIAGPAHRWVEGHRALRSGSKSRAIRSWNRGIASATQFRLPFEEALLNLAVARAGSGQARQHAIERAYDLATAAGALHLREAVLRSRPPS